MSAHTIAQALLRRETAGEFLQQRTPEWYTARQKILTASEISSVLDSNIYKSSYELMIQKLTPVTELNNAAVAWGVKFEPIASKFYEFLKKEKVYDLGLVIHSKHAWLGASPDGLLLSDKLLEIKVPVSRTITGVIPLQYWMQMQIQMEVCDMDQCDYLECSFYQYADEKEYMADNEVDAGEKGMFMADAEPTYWKLNKCFLKTVARDKKWFADNVGVMQQFHEKLESYKRGADPLTLLYADRTTNTPNKKRKHSPNAVSPSNTSSKRQRAAPSINLIDWRKWVSATQIRNYMIDDPLIDWLEQYYDGGHSQQSYIQNNADGVAHINGDDPVKNTYLDKFISENGVAVDSSSGDFYSSIMAKGVVFESEIVSKLKSKYDANFVTIATYQQARSTAKYDETIAHMKKGTPIIYQAVLHDHATRTYGMPDLLVRSDWLNKLFDEPARSDKKRSSRFSKKWHYRVIDIKYSSLEMCANGKHLRNSKTVLAFKGQVYIYNKILGVMQGYTPPKAYILGKQWSYKKGQSTYFGNSFGRAAHINFGDMARDQFIRGKTADAVRWVRDVRLKGHEWKLVPPTRPEIRPNMCNPDSKWASIKTKLADKTNNVTALWMCGPRNREIADDNRIKNWRRQSVVSEDLGICGDKTASTLQLIIDYNQDTLYIEPFVPTDQLTVKDLIYPKKIKNKLFAWQKTKNYLDFYIDFESINGSVADSELIFMVGVGYIDTAFGKWTFKTFCVESMTYIHEGKMLNEFHDYMDKVTAKFKTTCRKYKGRRLFHWGHHEQSAYRSAMLRHMDTIPKNREIAEWCNFLTVFRDEPIVVRGSLNFGLKSVAKAMYNNAFIDTIWPNDSKVSNGLNAMVYAWQEHKKCIASGKKLIDTDIMTEIVEYNEIDCKVVYKIIAYLRRAH